jgi:NitT/TauT family transport system substrate-binding protein
MIRSPHRRLLTAGSVALAATVTSGAWWAWRRRAPTPPIPISIARLAAPHSGLLHVAEANGYFADAGLAVGFATIPTGYDGIRLVEAGVVHVAGPAETPIARALAEGASLSVIATIFTSQSNSGVVARRDRGIDSPTDLAGRRIAFVFGTATHYLLETFLAYHGIPLSGVEMVAHPPEEAAAALVDGRVDALSIWTPHLNRVQRALGPRAVTFSPKDFYAETCNLVATPQFLGSQRAAVIGLIEALLRAEDFVRSDTDAALATIARASSMDVDDLVGAGTLPAFEVTLRQSLLLALENEIRWMYRRGLVRQEEFPDVLGAIAVEPLRSLRPLAVGIVK